MQKEIKTVAQALNEIKTSNKAAQIKASYDLIEEKLEAGASLSQVLGALNSAGIEMNLATFKSYLYRIRQSKKNENAAQSNSNKSGSLAVSQTPSRSIAGTEIEVVSCAEPVAQTIGDLDKVMNPDPNQQADQLAQYERLARINKRKNKL